MHLEEQLCKLLCLIIRFYNTSEEGKGRGGVVLPPYGSLVLFRGTVPIQYKRVSCTKEVENSSAEILFSPIKKLLTAIQEAVYVAYLKDSFLLVNLHIS